MQECGGVFRAEEKRGVGGTLLHGFEQHVLILLREQGAIFKNVDLARAFVRTDESVRARPAHDVHGDLGMLFIAHENHVGMNVPDHLAAVGTRKTGSFPAGGTLHRGGGIARGGRTLAGTAEDQRVGERAARSGFTQALRRIRLCKDGKVHGRSLSGKTTNTLISLLYRKNKRSARKVPASAKRRGKDRPAGKRWQNFSANWKEFIES